ncbi:Histone acetyltransferase [Cladobotryum mycophilum]|uniref:histone acetyltransferase n=1 Tax=Cladobotryum mycophilum TaxID=491253 RepID=A0ABR0SNX7_9HYPO
MADSDSGDGSLRSRLAAVLPKGFPFGIHHLSTPPTKTDALYSAPPGERPDRTYCEKHFLAVSIDAIDKLETSSQDGASQEAPQPKRALVLGVEIFIYTTARSTTLFVSKADSTGFLHKLGLPKGTPSPIREVCATFVRYLVDKRRRKDIQFVVSLFARAQDQYLFPGSVEYSGKHVLDDRGLVKWWCRVLDPLVESPPKGTLPAWKNAKGYLVVPGLDVYETRAFIPRRANAATLWSLSHPLERISHYHREFDWVPPRCLIPRFPDDPKSRFRDELDHEVNKTTAMRTTGSWKAVKTLDMFWEMMAYRQECSSGRMTGFIWVVFDDLEDKEKAEEETASLPTPTMSFKADTPGTVPETPKKQRTINVTPTSTPRRLFARKDANGIPIKPKEEADGRKKKSKTKKHKKKLRGVIIPRQPRIKTKQRNYLLDHPTSTAYYYWPSQGRGERIVDAADYKRILELLLHLDFSTLDKAVSSTRRWLSEVGLGGRWGYDVAGTRELPTPTENSTAIASEAPVNNLSGLVKRKRTDTVGEVSQTVQHSTKVNVLSDGLVRKKSKDQQDTIHTEEPPKPEINVLATGLVKKKPKA